MFDPFFEEEIIREEIIEEEVFYGRRPGYSGYGYGGGYGPSFGIDVTDGDIVENFGPIGIDLETGQAELNLGGFDIPF